MTSVLFISHEFPPMVGGAGVVCENIAKLLLRQGWDIRVITTKIKNRPPPPVPLSECPDIRFIQPLFFLLPFLRWKRQYSRIIINDMGSLLFALLFLNRADRKRTIYILQGQDHRNFGNNKLILRLVGYDRKFAAFFRQIDRIIAVSNFVKEDFIRHTGLTEIAEKTKIVHNFVDESMFFYKDKKEKVEIPILLTVTRIDKMKGLEDIHNILLLLSKDKKFQWLVIGNGKDAVWFSELIAESPIKSSIEWLQNVARSDLSDYYRTADVFILLSNYVEAFGLVYIEASSCGTPVIGRDSGGVREAILSGKTGFLVKDLQEAYQILHDEEYARLDRLQVASHSMKYAADRQISLVVDVIRNN